MLKRSLLNVFQNTVSIARLLVDSRSKNKDKSRRERILNILLLSFILLTCIALADALISELFHLAVKGASRELILILCFLLFNYYLSRIGKSNIASYIIITSLYLLTTWGAYRWGADFPQGLLTYALIIVFSGILINSRLSLIVAVVIGISLSVITIVQLVYLEAPQLLWQRTELTMGDTIVATVTFLVIAIVSWLFNREGELALKRARLSEKALQRERDSLAQKVEEKTKALRQEQAVRVAQLYKFAEFGKSASEFLHDLSNSVNLVSANLKQLESSKNNIDDMHAIVARATVGINRLESFILSTRKQVNNQDLLEYFSVNNEIYEAIEILNYKSKKNKVLVGFHFTKTIRIYGNPLKFHQFMCNFLSNAIDAYDGLRRKRRTVDIFLSKEVEEVKIIIQDFGKGISAKDLEKIFEPFFSTKGYRKGTGVGLSISYDIVTKDFKGQVLVDSKLNVGSTFTITFPLLKKI